MRAWFEGIEGIEPESGLRRKAPAASAGPAAQKLPRWSRSGRSFF